MKLNLKQVLELTGIAKPRFDSARRRDLYGFMYEAYTGDGPVAAYENSRSRFGIEHVIAIGCIEYAQRRSGMDADLANSVVSNNFGLLTEAIETGAIEPENPADQFFVGAIFHVGMRSHIAGTVRDFQTKLAAEMARAAEPDAHPDEAVASVAMIDATSVYRAVKAKLPVEVAA